MNEQKGSRKYNGWSNYATWAVNLWLDNEATSYEYWSRVARAWRGDAKAAARLADQLEGKVKEAAPELGATLYADLLISALSEIDWVEIAERMLEAVGEEWSCEEDSCNDFAVPSMNPKTQPQRSDPQTEENRFGDLIFASTRAQALEDGVLVDVSETAKEAGFRFPVALTRTVFERYVVVPAGVEAQDERGRLWDIVSLGSLAARGSGRSVVPFSLHVRNSNRRGTPPLVTLKVECGPGDQSEPVITIMLPEED